MSDVLGIRKENAEKWFDTEDDSLSIELLVADIKEYLDSKGKDNRLIFCIDEIGQYIGEDTNLLLNLQSIVEELGTKCAGRVWVVVTSQEAIDTVTKVQASAFSKIQARFKTRLSLTSSSVDEVIKKRILAKTDIAEDVLKHQFNDNNSVLKNLICFTDSRADLKGYSSEVEFVETYPFIPYQFDLFQDALIQIRQHGNSGQHQSSGERSMLSGFQEVAQKLNEKDENAIVPFYLFYDTVNTFLESTIRRVIDRCDRAAHSDDGVEPYDVNVLKLLYLIRYIDDIPATVENLSTLMADSIQIDKIQLKEKVQNSLNRLLSQNFIAKNGLTYQFLTDDEQDIAREIKNTAVDSTSIISQIASIIFDDLYMKKNFTYGSNVIGFDQIVDETYHGSSTNSIKLRVVTTASDLATADSSALIMKSNNNEAICVLSDEFNYYDTIESALKIKKFSKSRNITQLSESIQSIIRGKNTQANAYEKEAKELIEKAVVNGTFYIAGQKVALSGSNAKERFDRALSELIESVYTKLSYIHKHYANDAEVLKIFNTDQTTLDAAGNANDEALDEMSTWFEMQHQKHLPTSMSDIQSRYKAVPYGWNEIDITAVVCELIVAKKVNVTYGGAPVANRDNHLINFLRKKSEIEKTIVEIREEIDQTTLNKVKSFLKEYLGVMDVPSDEDELVKFVTLELSRQSEKIRDLINRYYASGVPYPGRDVLSSAKSNIDKVLTQKKDSIALFKKLLEEQDTLLDDNEDTEDVFKFFETQKITFDKGLKLVSEMKEEEIYLESVSDAINALNSIKEIVSLEKPYKRISEIPNYIHDLGEVYEKLLTSKKNEINEYLEDAAKEIVDTAKGDAEHEAVKSANIWILKSKKDIEDCTSLAILDSKKAQIDSLKSQTIKAIFDAARKAILEEKRKQAQQDNENNEDAVEIDEPKIKVAQVSKNALIQTIQLKTPEEIEQYTDMIKKNLLKKLEGNDYIQII